MRVTLSDRRPSPTPRSTVEDDDHTEASTATGDSPTEPADDGPQRTRVSMRPRIVLAVLLAVAFAGGLAFAGVQFFTQRAKETARVEALAAAKRYATDLSSYDYRNLDGNFRAVEQNATGEFGEQYRQVSRNLTELIKQHQAVSKGAVLSAGLVESGTDRAVVALFVDQTITNTNSPQPRIDRNRMQMTLVRQDDRWLVDNVTLL